ncbi:transcriptional regulator with XRE-family HTH domain [Streptomyces sp. CZ24]|nr:transcriptional regulator with XRE-family HTH domain [Streptomyces sp. CZ24]
MPNGPAVRRRKLGAELKALRGRAGLTSGQAAGLLGWHQSKVSRIETARSGVKPEDVRRLLDAYAVREPRLRELLVALAGTEQDGEHRHWWHRYRGVLPPEYRDFISLESQATRMRTLETSVVPGLLQTPRYARAVTRASLAGVDQARVDALVEVRLARQEVLRGRAAAGAERGDRRVGAAPHDRRPGGDARPAGGAAGGGRTPPCRAPGAAVHLR